MHIAQNDYPRKFMSNDMYIQTGRPTISSSFQNSLNTINAMRKRMHLNITYRISTSPVIRGITGVTLQPLLEQQQEKMLNHSNLNHGVSSFS